MSVTGYVGLPGSGKTLELVARVIAARARGRQVYANFRLGAREWGVIHEASEAPEGYAASLRPELRDKKKRRLAERAGYRVGRLLVPFEDVHVLRSWDEVIAVQVMRDELGAAHRTRLVEDGEGWRSVRDCRVFDCRGCSQGITVAIDELNLWAPSRLWQELGVGVLNRWAYNRKDGLEILWTAQHEARIDKVAREVTDFIWNCKQIGGEVRVFGKTLHLRVFHRAKWVPALMTEGNRTQAKEGVRPAGMVDWQFSLFHQRVADAFDTYEHVSQNVELVAASARRQARALKAAG